MKMPVDRKERVSCLSKDTTLDQKHQFRINCAYFSVTGRSFEWIQSDVAGNLANIAYGQCLASYSNADGSSNWINMNCSRTLQFVCQERK